MSKTLEMGVGANASTRTTSFGYDELDRLLTITANDQKTWTYGYDEVGNKQSMVRPNGTATVYNYDDLNRLKGMATRKGTLAQAVAGTAPLVSRFDYHVRADGRRDQLTEAIAHPDGSSVTRTVNYGFDLANRLTDERGTNGEGKSYSKSYELDAAGNRKSLAEMREGQLYAQTSYAYNSLDWLTGTQTQTKDATSNVSYDYDANGAQVSQTTGNGTQSSTTGQKWDFEGHLLASGAVNAQGQWSGNRSTYSYDASGMRLSQASWNAAGAATDGTSYVWYGDRVTEERDEKGVLQAVYEHGQELGPLRLVRRAGTVAAPVEQERYFIGDGQDSTRQLLDENGVVKDSYFYDAFGVGLPGGQGATENSFKYTGQQQDASGLYYLRARFYNAGTGRFLSQDPLMGSAMDPVSMHRYLYASADPVTYIDPQGLASTVPDWLLPMLQGTDAHNEIGADFLSNLKNPNGNRRFYDKRFDHIFGSIGLPLDLPGFNALRPDLTDIDGRFFMEIKPLSAYGLREGPEEILEYQAGFAAHYLMYGIIVPTPNYGLVLPGNFDDYTAPPLLHNIRSTNWGKGSFAITLPPIGGLLLYKVFDPKIVSEQLALSMATWLSYEMLALGAELAPGMAPALVAAWEITATSIVSSLEVVGSTVTTGIAAIQARWQYETLNATVLTFA